MMSSVPLTFLPRVFTLSFKEKKGYKNRNRKSLIFILELNLRGYETIFSFDCNRIFLSQSIENARSVP